VVGQAEEGAHREERPWMVDSEAAVAVVAEQHEEPLGAAVGYPEV
jgi:hypothetical protein